MGFDIGDFLLTFVYMLVITFLGSWWIGGLIEAIKGKKSYAIGMYIPVVALWIKYLIKWLIFV